MSEPIYYSSVSFEGTCPFCGAMLVQRDNDSACPIGHYRMKITAIGIGIMRLVTAPPVPVPQAFYDAFEEETNE